jgi:hypothetical protein
MLADNAVDIHHSRLVICPRTAGPFGPFRGSEAIWRVVDRSMQILRGLGITDDTIVARLFRDIRPFRIYDAPPRSITGRSPAGIAGGLRGALSVQGPVAGNFP